MSKDADLTVAFEVELPELYTVTEDEYETMHSSWIKAMKVLPEHSIVCKQDWFIQETYRSKSDGEEQSFLTRSYELHFNERPYLNHRCYLFLTKTTRDVAANGAISAPSAGGFLLPGGDNRQRHGCPFSGVGGTVRTHHERFRAYKAAASGNGRDYWHEGTSRTGGEIPLALAGG